MGKKSFRYVEIRIKGQAFTFQVQRIQYRNRQGRLTKFRKGQYLSMEVVGLREVIDKKSTTVVLRPRILEKYSTGLRKRRRKITTGEVERRIQARLVREKRTVSMEETLEGTVKFTYPKTIKKTNKKKGLSWTPQISKRSPVKKSRRIVGRSKSKR